MKFEFDGKRRYKARLVAQGFTQKYSENYITTYSPVVDKTTVRASLTLAAAFDVDIYQYDVVTAFLNGDLEEGVKILMKVFPGFEEYSHLFESSKSDSGNGDRVLELLKAIYGLKQAARQWNIISYMSFWLGTNSPRLTAVCISNLRKII